MCFKQFELMKPGIKITHSYMHSTRILAINNEIFSFLKEILYESYKRTEIRHGRTSGTRAQLHPTWHGVCIRQSITAIYSNSLACDGAANIWWKYGI
jgi:hypothetical protein